MPVMLTLAPEHAEAGSSCRQLADAGLLLCAGHTDASYEQVRAAIADCGLRGFTHLFNAMSPLQGHGNRAPSAPPWTATSCGWG